MKGADTEKITSWPAGDPAAVFIATLSGSDWSSSGPTRCSCGPAYPPTAAPCP